MTLQKKIISSFILSAVIISAFIITALLSFIEIRKEILYLELTDSIRTKSLQVRRHEKNFLIYREQKEIDSVHQYIGEIHGLIAEGRAFDNKGMLVKFGDEVHRYDTLFADIVSGVFFIEKALDADARHGKSAEYSTLIKAAFVERPLATAKYIKTNSPALSALSPRLETLAVQISELRKTGEEIINISREIDKLARQKVERAITISEIAALIIFPLFFLVGVYGLFFVSRGVVKRLNILTRAAESTGKGDFTPLKVPFKNDEVGVLVRAFDKMETDLRDRDLEIKNKNEELYQSRKLASIGTLASGVAHELNNPLNNIYLSAQVLMNEIPHGSPPIVQETVEEIYSETLRVKRIVGDLLEFSRGKQPQRMRLDLVALIKGIINQKQNSTKLVKGYAFVIEAPEQAYVMADRHMMEQVFINLADNAIDAMPDGGKLGVAISEGADAITVKIEDTGRGISPADLMKIYDPFFTTKEKGTGLGLSIVYGIIEKHGGTIKVETEEGRGTRISLNLPKEK